MSGQLPHQKVVAIAASFTAEPLGPALAFLLKEAGLGLEVRFAPYHQVFQELLGPAGLLGMNLGGVNVVLVRIEDYIREAAQGGETGPIAERTGEELAQALTQNARRASVPTIIAALPPSPAAPPAMVPYLKAATARLIACAKETPGITLLAAEDIDSLAGDQGYDPIGDELAHIPFTEERYAATALAIARKVHALLVPSHKVLVLDCDNTLWRGVVGEDGVQGIEIGPAQSRLQQFAVQQQAEGTLVCLVSKNTERDVIDVLQGRRDMVLKPEHIVAHRINWETKPANLTSLARALDLGLDAFVFVDDNPVECAQMRSALPQVVTLQLPSDEAIESFLTNLWVFDRQAVTAEDIRRTAMYRENLARQELEESVTDIVEFMRTLEMRIDVQPPEEPDWNRVAQLTQRTNQFNFTSVRRTEPEMRALVRDGLTVLRVRVSDRFGDYGIVGLLIAQRSADAMVVDTLLLSCRVLGRGVEHAMVRRLGELARDCGLSHVELRHVPTARNEPALAFAESIAAEFRIEERGQRRYRIPASHACAIVHRPGHDPAAVLEARRAEGGKISATAVGRSERYSRLAAELVTGRAVLQALRKCGTRARSLPGTAVPPKDASERDLLELWRDVLGIEGLGVEDDYFAVGGTSLVAARLFAEVARRFGVKLPLTTILGAPTVRSLARQVFAQVAHRQRCLVQLRPGGPGNFFLVHDGDGETLLYLGLSLRMPQDLAVYGIEPKRLPSIPLAHTSVERMAAFYVEQIRTIQPTGPYLLGGMCAGGVIAYEMASQLVAAGERVDLVAIMDAAAPGAPKLRGRVAKQRIHRLIQALSGTGTPENDESWHTRFITAAGKVVAGIRWEAGDRARRWLAYARFGVLRVVLARDGRRWPPLLPALTVRQIYDAAEARYVPQPLRGVRTLLVRARKGQAGDTPYREIFADEALGWGSLSDSLEVVDVDGGHASMLREPYAECLAAELQVRFPRARRSLRSRAAA